MKRGIHIRMRTNTHTTHDRIQICRLFDSMRIELPEGKSHLNRR